MKANIAFFLFFCNQNIVKSAILFETYQLPLSDQILKTFPKVTAKYFIIVNTDLNLVLHELNSTKLLRCGTFSKLIYTSALQYKFGKRAKLINDKAINKRAIIDDFLIKFGAIFPKFTDISLSTDGELISIYDMSRLYALNFKQTFMFKSENNGYGIAFTYKNINNCKFVCILFGCKYNPVDDVKNIKLWLNKFILKGSKTKIYAKIPVFYGTYNYLPISINTNNYILSTNLNPERVIRTIRYTMRLKAPIKPEDQIGWIFYQTNLFKNSIKYPIKANKQISKSSVFRRIKDSISLIIYNRPCKA